MGKQEKKEIRPIRRMPTMPDKKVAAHEAKHGKKMIEVSLRFWTNNISSEAGEKKTKKKFAVGGFREQGKKSHRSIFLDSRPFLSLPDVWVGGPAALVVLTHIDPP